MGFIFNQKQIESCRCVEMKKDIQLYLIEEDDREQFILDNQEAFNYGALEEFVCRDKHLKDDGQIIS